MRTASRRAFLAAGSGAFFHVLTARKGLTAQASPRRVVVHTEVPVGVIRPELHGHFAEHLGSCTYGGLWVGKNSPVPNINGHRKLAVEYLRALGIPVLRWPGGCFADDYHWRDGIGPAARRPKRVNLWWGQYVEDNSFGTHEFVELCRLIGAEPYFAANLGSGTPQELREWVEYANFPSGSTLSDERGANGSPEPFRVRYWGVGNENWGCGGRMTPDEYAARYRQFSNYLLARGGIGGTRVFLIACGPNRNDTEWTRRFFESARRGQAMVRDWGLHGYAMHFYSNSPVEATKHTADTMRQQLASFADLERGIHQQHALLRSYDPEGRIGLLIDEWGIWDRMNPDEDKRYGRLWQQIPMRGALAAAMGLNVFHRQADKLVMGNIAQTVNVLHSMLLTDGPHCVRTPAYYAFELAKPHRGKTALRFDSDDRDPTGLSVSVSREGPQIVLTCVNPKPDETLRVECVLAGATAASATARLLHHPDLNACNTFDKPDTIVPKDHPVEAARDRLRLDLPPLSVATVTLRLA